jgi:hypothetical protein
MQSLRTRLGSALSTNGHAEGADAAEPEERVVPRPKRTVTAARARAGAAVAARRSPVEVWGLRIVAAVVVAVMLITLLLFLLSLA